MANTSRVPAAIDGLIALLASISAPVSDGPLLGEEQLKAWVEVGTGDLDRYGVAGEEGAQSRIEWAGLRGPVGCSRDETLTVHCAIFAWNGDADLRAARVTAYELWAECEAAVASDPAIGGAVMFGRVSDGVYRPAQDDSGATVVVLFAVECRARLSP